MVPANTAAPDGVSDAREAPAVPVAGLGEAPAGGVGHPGGQGRSAILGDPSGSALVQSADDSRSPSIVGGGREAGRERVAGGRALGLSATNSRSPTLD